jgi:K+-transporting ATPase KdpF subunit
MRIGGGAHERRVNAVTARPEHLGFSCLFHALPRLCPARFHAVHGQSALAFFAKGVPMTFDLLLAALVALGLLVYLTAVLLRPERF